MASATDNVAALRRFVLSRTPGSPVPKNAQPLSAATGRCVGAWTDAGQLFPATRPALLRPRLSPAHGSKQGRHIALRQERVAD